MDNCQQLTETNHECKTASRISRPGVRVAGYTTLEPLKKQSLDRAAADSLRAAIISGGLPQGSRLTEASLAERFSLSRGTVRAALQRLVAEGLVVQRPYSGWDVVALTLRDAKELTELRSSLEALAAGLVANRIDDAARAAIRAAFDDLRSAAQADRVSDLVGADMALHRKIVELSDNRRLGEHYSMISNQVRLYIASSTMVVAGMTTIVARHSELIEPIMRGAAVDAEAAARAHSVRSGEEIAAHLRLEQELARAAESGAAASFAGC